MRLLKSFFRSTLPPFIFQGLKKILIPKQWSGNYISWNEARAKATGYQDSQILKKQIASQKKVISGEYAFERDTVLFKEPDPDFKLLASLAVVTRSEPLRVLDFGGALGSTYIQHRQELGWLGLERWIVVEQPHFVSAGKRNFQDSILRFEEDFDEALARHAPTVILASSVLQYLEHPFAMVDRFAKSGVQFLFLNKVALNADAKERLTLQRVPRWIYEASYPCWFFDEEALLRQVISAYDLLWEFENEDRADIPSRFKGFLLRKRTV